MKYKNFFKKTIFAQILLIILVIGSIVFFKLSLNLVDTDNDDGNLAVLFINFNNQKRFFEGEVVEDMTMLDALSVAVSVGKIKLNYAIDNSGNVRVAEIDGHTNGTDNKYFIFYLNSKKVSVEDLNKEVVHGGDRIEIQNE